MLCKICGSLYAYIRPSEKAMALISSKAHIDCNGHSHYRYISHEEWNKINIRGFTLFLISKGRYRAESKQECTRKDKVKR
jgi:hypothetical protein